MLDIDPDAVAARILACGGTRVGESRQRRYVYDIDPADRSRWLRLRDTGSETTLAVKEVVSDAIGGTRETEVAVSDFDTAHALLAELGYTPRPTRRTAAPASCWRGHGWRSTPGR